MTRDEFTPAQEARAEAEQAAADDARDEYVRLTTNVFTGTETAAQLARREALVEAYTWTLGQVDELDDAAFQHATREGS